MLKYLPNAITTLRLLLAVPLGIVILQRNYELALTVIFLAGLSDALDGYAARSLNSFSRFGAALDPIADKILVTVAFVCLAKVQVIPWYVAIIIVSRDLIIVGGAVCYRLLIGPFEFEARLLSKLNMIVQMCFCVLLLAAQLLDQVPAALVEACTWLALLIAIASGADYVISWGHKAMNESGGRKPDAP